VFDELARKTKARTSDNNASFSVWGLKADAVGTSGLPYLEDFRESGAWFGFVDMRLEI